MRGLGGVVHAVVDFLVDERCHGCGAAIAPRAHFPLTGHPAVDALAEPVDCAGPPGWRLRTRLLCRSCIHEIDPWREPVALPGDASAAGRGIAELELFPAFTTDPRLLALVHVLKFGRRERIAAWLGRALVRGLAAGALSAGSVVVPVPMDRASRRRRGFNQAESLAREVARQRGLPLAPAAIEKPRPTAAQSLLGRDARARNLAGAFRPGPRAADIRGRDVVLVDDLVTTGATVRACAVALGAAGATSVRVVCAGYRP